MSDDLRQTTIFDILYKEFKITKPIRLIELFAGYGSQYFALKYINANVEHYKICEWAVKSIQAYNDAHIRDYNNYSKDMKDDEVLDYLIKKGVSINYNTPATKEQLKRQKYRTIYNNIIATNNLVNIQNAKGEDFEIKDKETFTYLLTYSFPCQDLSLAGKGKGMSDTSTRSGMLWEVERILKELKEKDQLPDVLLMENVPQVHGLNNVDDFNKWQLELEKLGYKNYFQDLIATDYGIPQTRNRCFMVSILGDYSYTFPPKQELKLKLKDMLENEVDEKYYLTDSMIEYLENGKYQSAKVSSKLKQTDTGICPTLDTMQGGNRQPFIKVKNATKKGYLEAYPGDRVYTNTSTKRGTVQPQSIQTLTTFQDKGVVMDDLRIRKLTPKECFRLMGVKDEDFEKIAKNQSDSSLYHLAGDSIVVNVLMAIFMQFFKN